MSVGRTLKSYLFWTYERGSFHYDVMVTLILAFLFVTPHLWDYGDRPVPPRSSSEIGVQVTAKGFIYEIPAARVHADSSTPLQSALQQQIMPVSGPVAIDRWEPVKDAHGHLTTWRVWAHR
ncbi:hypothetical protein [Paracidobacterium acidisoli]|uniref:Uncharacterized protein n=1 Tax=Paracidobacterium acidisoli TaxID=2303751 RepID=A0A372IKF6_9BACT|nr:hypothetical protein [Paracidobacterium acidisoli]MBT9332820.1 hypothetical protein [Paracidobacterium acidisoli]